jgi:hypothetical protein
MILCRSMNTHSYISMQREVIKESATFVGEVPSAGLMGTHSNERIL